MQNIMTCHLMQIICISAEVMFIFPTNFMLPLHSTIMLLLHRKITHSSLLIEMLHLFQYSHYICTHYKHDLIIFLLKSAHQTYIFAFSVCLQHTYFCTINLQLFDLPLCNLQFVQRQAACIIFLPLKFNKATCNLLFLLTLQII